MHHKGALHLRLSPQRVLVSYSGSRAGLRVKLVPPPLLVAVPSAPRGRRDNRDSLRVPLQRSTHETADADDEHEDWRRFAAPEVLREREPFATLRSDVWSIGAIVAVLYAISLLNIIERICLIQ